MCNTLKAQGQPRIPVALVLLLIIACFCIGFGILLGAIDIPQQAAYEEISRNTSYTPIIQPAITDNVSVTVTLKQASQHTARDWNTLWEINSQTTAWVTVENTTIDYPVVSTSSREEEEWYLYHTLWGDWSVLGTPFIDYRCAYVQEPHHMLVYGHHMTSSDAMFSMLQDAYLQDCFDTLASLVWDTPSSSLILQPLCALTVDASWEQIQRFDFDSDDDYRSWLFDTLNCATAVSPDAHALLLNATHDITLVTCTSNISNQPERTLVIWVL
ncbi:MAG: class B sortase [Coriobacteriales bacterium]|nr:class B sortase [Coriobacteriales bacterium]